MLAPDVARLYASARNGSRARYPRGGRVFLMCDSEQTAVVEPCQCRGVLHPKHRTIPIASARSPRLRVLVAEDSLVLRHVTRSLLLSRWQMDLRMVTDGAEAVRAAVELGFDIVLMDLQMPVMDGFAATKCIRKFEAENPSRRRTPVLAYTSSPMASIAAQMLDSGMDSLLAKPTDPHQMCRTLHRWGAGKINRVLDAACDREVPQLEFA
jgi:CheY-like chemotaxis protein